MVSFNIILRNDTVVLYSGLVQKVGGVSLLKKRITDVFFIAQDFVDGARPPFCFTGAGENTVSFKSLCNLAFKVLPVNALYNFSLFRVDDKVSFIVLGVAKKMVVIDLYLSILVAELKSQLYVLAEGL